jgi:hypothetical protein
MKKAYAMFTVVVVLVVGCGEAAKPEKFSSKTGQFSIIFPAHPKSSTKSFPTPAGTFESHIYSVEQRNGIYAVEYADVPTLPNSDVQKLLDSVCDLMLRPLNGTEQSRTRIKQKGYPGREVSFTAMLPGTTGNSMGRIRLFFVGNRFYQITAAGREQLANSENADKFIKSFKILVDGAE